MKSTCRLLDSLTHRHGTFVELISEVCRIRRVPGRQRWRAGVLGKQGRSGVLAPPRAGLCGSGPDQPRDQPHHLPLRHLLRIHRGLQAQILDDWYTEKSYTIDPEIELTKKMRPSRNWTLLKVSVKEENKLNTLWSEIRIGDRKMLFKQAFKTWGWGISNSVTLDDHQNDDQRQIHILTFERSP